MREEDESNIRGGETDMDLYTPVDSLVICNQSHVCKNAQCSHKIPHKRNCANPMPCHDFEFESGKIPDSSMVPISACVAISTDGHYYTGTREMCPHCQGGGYIHHAQRHKIPNR